MINAPVKSSYRLVTSFLTGFLFLACLIVGQNVMFPGKITRSAAAGLPGIAPNFAKDGLGPVALSSQRNVLIGYTTTNTLYLPIAITAPGSGSGGDDPAATACNPSGGSGGLSAGTVQEVTVGGLVSSVVVGDSYVPQTPTYLVFYLHGDEGNYNQFQINGHKVSNLIKEKGWVFVAPRAIQASDGKYSWWKSADENIPALTAVFEEMFAKYNLCRNTILAATLSGGSTFWTRNFFPEQGGSYPVHAILFCGGVPPNSEGQDKVMALGQNSNVVNRSSFKFRYGTEDFLLNLIQQTIELYSDAGLTVTQEQEAGVGHCVSSTSRKMRDFLEEKATELGLD